MPSTTEELLPRASAVDQVIDEATWVLMSHLHCGGAEALALLRAQSHSAHVDLAEVAAAMVESDSSR